MTTAKITATFAMAGKIAIQFDTDISDHYAREILDAIGETIQDKWNDGNVTRIEKDKLSLTRKPKDDSLDQITVPGTEIEDAQFSVIPQLGHDDTPALPEPETDEVDGDEEPDGDAATEEGEE